MNGWSISPETRGVITDGVALRREVHQYPEQGFKETRTSALIEEKLKSYGVETRRMCETGVVGLLRGVRPGPTILIRADIDALPVIEENKVPYKSRINGVMHA
jgi:amidohydrolase